MKTLFTRNLQSKFLKSYEYIAALFVLFLILSLFSVPKVFVSTIDDVQGKVESIVLKREPRTSIKSPSKGYSDFYEIKLKTLSVPLRCYETEQIKSYGAKNLIGKYIDLEINKKEKYHIVRQIVIRDVSIVKVDDIGFFPFFLFVGLGIITMVWSIWGFYITYLASDEKRKEILGE